MPTWEDVWMTLAQLVAGLLVAAAFVAIIRQAAHHQNNKQARSRGENYR